MFIELVDSLRCVEAHDDTWLVAAVTRMDGRHISEGLLGCPICRREYPIRDGIGWFSRSPIDPVRLTSIFASTDTDRVMRAGALLGLTDAGGVVVLDDGWADCAEGLAGLGPSHVVTLNARVGDATEQVSMLVVDDRLPFARAGVRAVALGSESSAIRLIGSATDAVRGRGRLIAPIALPVPDGVTELARDDSVWVGERAIVGTPPIALRSARR